MYKNANIKSKKEAIQRMMDGEVFYGEGGAKIYYEEASSGAPFRCVVDGRNNPLTGLFDLFDEWQTKTEWYENIPEQGVLCWVWVESPAGRQLRVIVRTDHDSFIAAGGGAWKNAEPVKLEEIEHLLLSSQSND